MFCKECGGQLEAGAQFCPECGARVEEIKVQESDGGAKKSKKWIMIVGILVVVAAVVLMIFINKSKNKYSGYYIYAIEEAGEYGLMRIKEEKVMFFLNTWGDVYYFEGYLEKGETSAEINLETSANVGMGLSGTIRFVESMDDSERLSLSFDKSGYISCNIVNKNKSKEFFKEYIEEDMKEDLEKYLDRIF